MLFKISTTKIAGCTLLTPFSSDDLRGCFVKTFHLPTFESLGLPTLFREEYYSISKKNVLRGIHFQTPPNAHDKIVICQSGRVIDVVVDLRVGSRTFGQFERFELSGETPQLVYIQAGLGHGFYSLADHSMLAYKVTTEYFPESDAGVHWSSFAGAFPVGISPIISIRDDRFPTLENFSSPFSL